MKIFYAMILVLALAACGGSGGGSSSEASDKNLAITVHNSDSPETGYGHIDYFLITITGEDMDPVTERVDGSASGATVLGIPVGTQRKISIEGYNDYGQVVRRASKEGLEIFPDAISSVDVSLKVVPVFSSPRPNTATSNTRLQFSIFGETGSSLTVSRVDDEEEETQIIDASTNVAYVTTDSEDGQFEFDPGTLSYGNYTFKVEDTETKESSTVKVALYPSLARPGVSIGSNGGSLKKIGNQLVITNFGGTFYQNSHSRDNDTGNGLFLKQLERIYEE